MDRFILDTMSTDVRNERPEIVEDRCLAEEIVCAIRRSTMHGVRDLSVEVYAGRISLSGECASYYTKQLAQEATVSIRPDVRIVNEIAVAAYRPR
ncbi:MAG: BON domain-containing protein [Pirellulales bacterium]